VTRVGSVRDEKGGWPHARSPQQLREQVQESLKHLRLDSLDLVNLRVGGGADGHSSVPGSIEEPFTALAQMQQEGLDRQGQGVPPRRLADAPGVPAQLFRHRR